MSNESIKPPATSGYSLDLKVDYFNNPKFWVEFNGSCLKSDSVSFNYKKIDFYIADEIKPWPYYFDNGFTLGNSLFGGVKLNKMLIVI